MIKTGSKDIHVARRIGRSAQPKMKYPNNHANSMKAPPPPKALRISASGIEIATAAIARSVLSIVFPRAMEIGGSYKEICTQIENNQRRSVILNF